MKYPSTPDQITTAWLEQRLARDAGALRGFESQAVGTGQMCGSYRLTLDWVDGVTDGPTSERPATVIAKCPSTNPDSRNIASVTHTYVLETSWYRDLATQIPVRCPHCFFVELDPNGVDFALLLEDMAPAEQGDQLGGASIPEIAGALEQAAALHAALWNSPELDRYEWLRLTESNQEIVRAMLPGLYQGFRERYTSRLAPEILEMGDELLTRLDGYLGNEPAGRSLVHGDFRVDNLLFREREEAGPEVIVVDWQTASAGAGIADVAYLLGTSIADPAVRAAEEERLFQDYLEQLSDRGAADVDPEACWRDYRLAAFSGFVMAVFASMNVERTERGDEMFAVMAERPAQQALHLDSLSLL